MPLIRNERQIFASNCFPSNNSQSNHVSALTWSKEILVWISLWQRSSTLCERHQWMCNCNRFVWPLFAWTIIPFSFRWRINLLYASCESSLASLRCNHNTILFFYEWLIHLGDCPIVWSSCLVIHRSMSIYITDPFEDLLCDISDHLKLAPLTFTVRFNHILDQPKALLCCSTFPHLIFSIVTRSRLFSVSTASQPLISEWFLSYIVGVKS